MANDTNDSNLLVFNYKCLPTCVNITNYKCYFCFILIFHLILVSSYHNFLSLLNFYYYKRFNLIAMNIGFLYT